MSTVLKGSIEYFETEVNNSELLIMPGDQESFNIVPLATSVEDTPSPEPLSKIPMIGVIDEAPVNNTSLSKLTEAVLSETLAKPETIILSNKSSKETKSEDSSFLSTDLIKVYLTDIGKEPLLTKADEIELSIAIKAGEDAKQRLANISEPLTSRQKRQLRLQVREGQEATNRFVVCNLRLVVSIAKRYQGNGLELLDLIQEGNLGMMHAVEKFDHTKGFKFSTYATWWIKQTIDRSISDKGRNIRLPVHVNEQIRNLQKARFKYLDEFGIEPTISELSKALFIPEDKVSDLMNMQRETLSLEEPIGENHYIGDTVADKSAEEEFENAILNNVYGSEVSKLMEPLDERERQVIKLRFGLDDGKPRTLVEVGEHFNLTRERIRQIQKRAVYKMQHHKLHGDSSIVE